MNTDQELSDLIQALSGGGAAVNQTATLPNANAVVEPQAPSPVLDVRPAPSAPVPPRPQGTPNVLGDAKPHDVVQVNNPESEHHGAFFTIGDIREGWVHGYVLMKGRAGKEFITVKATDVHRIGEAKVRSMTPCSSMWLEEHEGAK